MSTGTTFLRADFEIDVEQGQLAATVVAPASEHLAEPHIVFVCVPGMSYRRTYWDLHVDGETGYSFAEHAAELGHIVVTLDNLGVGDSSAPAGGGDVGFERLGHAVADASSVIADRIAAGTLVPGLDAVADARLVGLGHSMGAGVAIAAQALRAPWLAVAPLGFPTQEIPGLYDTAPPEAVATPTKRWEWARDNIPQAIMGQRWQDIDTYFLIDRPSFNDLFYGPEVPQNVIDADIALATVAPRQAWLEAVASHAIVQHAASIDAPVFLCYGSGDLSPNPRAEPAAWRSSNDITVLLLEDTAHCHNLAGTRASLWDRLCGWATSVV
jgi:pimeloyl-ACP methyl ester carboxylesterase